MTVATLDNPLCEKCGHHIVYLAEKATAGLRVARLLAGDGYPTYVLEYGASGEVVRATNIRKGLVLNQQQYRKALVIHRRSHRCPDLIP